MLILQFHFRICDQSPKKNKNKQNQLKNNFKRKILKLNSQKHSHYSVIVNQNVTVVSRTRDGLGKQRKKIKNQIPQETKKKVGSDYDIGLQCAEQEPTCPIPSSMILVVKQSPQHCMQNLCPHSRPVKYQERKHTFLPNKSST